MKNYFNDTICAAAKSVLAYLRGTEGIESSWDKEKKEYLAEPTIAEWYNGRERGYVVMLHSIDYKRRLNIAFFEHRNSDSICAVKWEQTGLNPPTINDAEFGDIYKDKYDVSHSVNYSESTKMADWIMKQLNEWWSLTYGEWIHKIANTSLETN